MSKPRRPYPDSVADHRHRDEQPDHAAALSRWEVCGAELVHHHRQGATLAGRDTSGHMLREDLGILGSELRVPGWLVPHRPRSREPVLPRSSRRTVRRVTDFTVAISSPLTRREFSRSGCRPPRSPAAAARVGLGSGTGSRLATVLDPSALPMMPCPFWIGTDG